MRGNFLKWSVFTTLITMLAVFASLRDESITTPPPNPHITQQKHIEVGNLVRRSEVLMGEEFVFEVDGKPEIALAALDKAVRRIEELERTVAPWRPGSETAHINQMAGIGPVKISPNTMALLEESQKAERQTNGAFDITVGERNSLVLDKTAGTALLSKKGATIVTGGIQAGYAIGVGLEILKNNGVERAAIRAGGIFSQLGDIGPWIAEIKNPLWPGTFVEHFAAGGTTVATITRKIGDIPPLVDPRTDFSAKRTLSVTIVTPSPALAEAYASAVMVMGLEKGMAWVEATEGVESLILDDNGDAHRSSGWASGWAQVASPPHANIIAVNIEKNTPHDSTAPPPPFIIDITETSNQEYKAFLDAAVGGNFDSSEQEQGKSHQPRYWKEYRSPLFLKTAAASLAPFDAATFQKPDHPVVGIDWWDASAYCRWSGKRLPTLAEWRFAARGPTERIWPWGDVWDFKKANTGGEKWGEQDGYIYSAPVFSFPEGHSPLGAFNMAGNVAEWTEDGFVAGGSSNSSPSGVTVSSAVAREHGYRSFDIGFRCVRDAP